MFEFLRYKVYFEVVEVFGVLVERGYFVECIGEF